MFLDPEYQIDPSCLYYNRSISLWVNKWSYFNNREFIFYTPRLIWEKRRIHILRNFSNRERTANSYFYKTFLIGKERQIHILQNFPQIKSFIDETQTYIDIDDQNIIEKKWLHVWERQRKIKETSTVITCF